jgi:undecaprenyl-diphosphatase
MDVDAQALLAVNQAFSGGAATLFFRAVTLLGNGAVLAALIVPPLFVFARDDLKRHLAPLVIAVALGGLAVFALKLAVDRPRPPVALAALNVPLRTPDGVPPDASFPSGHAQTAFAAATYLALLYRRRAWIFLALAALVALSRVALGVHYPSDVIAGAFLGSALSIATFLVAQRRAAPG